MEHNIPDTLRPSILAACIAGTDGYDMGNLLTSIDQAIELATPVRITKFIECPIIPSIGNNKLNIINSDYRWNDIVTRWLLFFIHYDIHHIDSQDEKKLEDLMCRVLLKGCGDILDPIYKDILKSPDRYIVLEAYINHMEELLKLINTNFNNNLVRLSNGVWPNDINKPFVTNISIKSNNYLDVEYVYLDNDIMDIIRDLGDPT